MKSHNLPSINFDKAKQLALNASEDYQLQYCLFHTKLGKLRNQKFLQALTHPIVIKDEATMLAIYLAIFGKPNEGSWFGSRWLGMDTWSFHRSSRLASLIADEWIIGDFNIDQNNCKDTLASNVFDAFSLNKSKLHKNGALTIVPGDTILTDYAYAYIEKTKAVRFLLQNVINLRYAHERNYIENLSKQFRLLFEDSHEKKFSCPSLLSARERDKARAISAVEEIVPKKKLPKVMCNLIGDFFSRSDIVKLTRLNRATHIAAKTTDNELITNSVKVRL